MSAGHEESVQMITDIDGQLYVTAITDGASDVSFMNYDDSVADIIEATGSGGQRVVVGKISTDGLWIYTAKIDGSGTDVVTSIDVDGVGNLYVAGYHDGDLTYYNIDETVGLTGSAGTGQQIWLARLDRLGIWDNRWRVDATSHEINPSIVSDQSGSIYLAGQGATGGVLNFYNPDNSVGQTGTTADGSSDQLFLGKIVNEALSQNLLGFVK